MSGLITTAASQYANRPKDQQFASLDALIASGLEDKNHSAERNYNLKDLRVIARGDDIRIEGPKGEATFTHWSFGQLCRMLGAPAGYMRKGLTPQLVADCLDHGLQTGEIGATASVLLRQPNGNPTPVFRCCTTDSYSRVWDCDLAHSAQQHVFNYTGGSGQAWQNAPTWEGEQIAGFRSDRDSFILQIDGGSIVTDPSAGQGEDGKLYRGIMLRNSEVGASSITIEVVLFRYICGNWNLWGAVLGQTWRRRHVGTGLNRAVLRELASVARNFTQRPASADDALIRSLISHELAHTREAVIDELRKMGASKDVAEAAYDRTVQTEKASPRSFWGIAQGVTRLSQDSGYQDERYTLDKLGALILARGARVAA